MKIINKFKLYGVDWKIKEVEKIVLEEDNDIEGWGGCAIDSNTVYVSSDIPNEERERIVILHELMHAIFGENGYWDDYYDEKKVQMLALGLNESLKTMKNKLF